MGYILKKRELVLFIGSGLNLKKKKLNRFVKN